MRFRLKLHEIQFIQNQFHFSQLIGVEKRFFPQFGVEKELKSRGIIVERDGKQNDISSEYRYLFSSWEKMKYSVVRPDSNAKDKLFCVLANRETIILFDQVGKNVEIELIDFSSDAMDNILFNMGEFDLTVSAKKTFNISLPVKEFMQMMSSQKDKNLDIWSSKLGINNKDLKFYFEMMNKEEDFFMYLCEDHQKQTGTLIKIVKTPEGYCALKHVTPKERVNEKMVMIVGDARTIIDSICIF